ncbi:MAG: hypothetical protein AB7R69_01740 [Candidatus Babeliales bacterium]
MQKKKILLAMLLVSNALYGAKDFSSITEFTKSIQTRMAEFWQLFSLPSFTKFYTDNMKSTDPDYPYRNQTAYVAKNNQMSAAERSFLTKRRAKAQQALSAFLGETVKQDLNVACAFSGGGYRAMIATAGWMEALEKLGILNSILYVSALSGSTWYLGPWLLESKTGGFRPRIRGVIQPAQLMPLTPSEFNALLVRKIDTNHFDIATKKDALTDFNFSNFNANILWPKIIFGQTITSVDLYGGVLSHYLLAQKGEARHQQRIFSQLPLVSTGNTPWPIYTAAGIRDGAVPRDFTYHWYEFNPEEVRNLEESLFFPSWAFGTKFSKGTGKFSAGQSFGFLMGIFGSAYTINAQSIANLMFPSMEAEDAKNKSVLDKAKKEVQDFANLIKKGAKNLAKGDIEKVFNDAKDYAGSRLVRAWAATGEYKLDIRKKRLEVPQRISPAQVFNPFKGFAQASSALQQYDYLTLVDAGLSYNIPIRPLFRPERKIDIIIVGDASANVVDKPNGDDSELVLGLKDVQSFYGITYNKVVDNKTFKVFEPQNNYKDYPSVKPPLIIYVNYMKDDAVLKTAGLFDTVATFDPQACVKESECNTFNFGYGKKTFNELSALAGNNLIANKEALKTWMKRRLNPAA